MADAHRGLRRRQDHRRIPPQGLLHRLHAEADLPWEPADQEDVLRQGPAGMLLNIVIEICSVLYYCQLLAALNDDKPNPFS